VSLWFYVFVFFRILYVLHFSIIYNTFLTKHWSTHYHIVCGIKGDNVEIKHCVRLIKRWRRGMTHHSERVVGRASALDSHDNVHMASVNIP